MMKLRWTILWAFVLGSALLASLTIGSALTSVQAEVPSDMSPAIQAATGVLTACVNSTGTGCGATCDVCYPSVQAAVDAVQAQGFVRIAQGTYTGSGDTVVFVDKPLVIEGGYDATCTTSVAGETILDGEFTRTVIEVAASGLVQLSRLTLTRGTGEGNCDTSASQYGGCGGGLYVLNTPISVSSCKFQNNRGSAIGSGAGGGAFVLNNSSGIFAHFINSSFENNVANTYQIGVGWGGGLYLDSGSLIEPSSVINCMLKENIGSADNEGYGGGAYIAGYAAVHNTLFLSNYAGSDTAKYGWGGGLYLWKVKGLELINNTLRGNVAVQNPGTQNYNAAGGAIFASTNISMTAINNIIVNNTARDEGTAVYFESFTVDPVNAWFYHNTIVGNKGNADSGAITLRYMFGDVNIYLANNIIAGHLYGISNNDPVNNDVSGENNLMWNTYNGITGDFPVIADPRLTPDYHPELGSPAIQAGKFLSPGIHFMTAFDKDGYPRPQGLLPNIGAYETTRQIVLMPVVLRR